LKEEKTKNPINIILIGDPAAGKATQASFLTRKYDLYDFDMGKELTVLRSKDKQVDEVLKQNTDKGNLSPTQIVRQILKDKISECPKEKGILFDGHPKMLGEAKLVSKLLREQGRSNPIVIYLSIPTKETITRMHKRVGYFEGKFGKRADDSVEALKNRVAYYRKNVSQVIDFFKQQYQYKKVSGLGNKSEVKLRIFLTIDKYLEKVKNTSK